MELVKKWVKYLIILSIIFVIGVLPVVFGFAGHQIGRATGCPVSFSGVHSCIRGGRDIGQLLHNMASAYWLALFSVPFAGICILGTLLYYFTGPKKPVKSS